MIVQTAFSTGMTRPRLSVLLLCDDDRAHAGNLLEHLAALRRHSRHSVRLYNARGVPRARFLDLDAFDVVVIHYSLVITSDNYVAPWLREKIRSFNGLKVQFLQDEYRWVNDITAMMRWLGIDVLFSIVPPKSIAAVYGGRLDDIEIVPTLAGFVSERFTKVRQPPRAAERPIDVGYRGRVLPYWLGALSQEKIAIGQRFLERASRHELRCNIAWSEADRIYGDAWIRFLCSCRAMLGTESGASITDFDGSIERATLSYLDQHLDAPFDEVFDAVLAHHEGNVMMNVISPRVFEAAALRTALVLHPGEYGGVLEPHRHYIPLEKDFSNFDDVVSSLRDKKGLDELTERTHEAIVASGKYSLRTFVREFDDVIERQATKTAAPSRRSFAAARVERAVITRSVFGLDFNVLRDRMRRQAIALTLVRELPELRTLARLYVRDRELRSRFGRARALEEALRLGLLLREQRANPLATEPFSVTPSLDEPKGVTFMGHRRADGAASPAIPTDAAIARFREADVPTILWNHTAVAPVVYLQRPGRVTVGLQVGYYRLLGVYHFGILEALAAREGELVLDALRPLFEPPAPERSAQAAHALESRIPAPRGKWRRIRPALGTQRRRVRLLFRQHRLRLPPALRVFLVVARALSTKRGRSLFRLYTRCRDVDLRSFVVDLVKLHVLSAASAGGVPSISHIGLAVDGADISYVSNGNAHGVLPSAIPRRIVWDNSRVGSQVHYFGVTLSLGSEGTYEFVALTRLLQQVAPDSWSKLLPAPYVDFNPQIEPLEGGKSTG